MPAARNLGSRQGELSSKTDWDSRLWPYAWLGFLAATLHMSSRITQGECPPFRLHTQATDVRRVVGQLAERPEGEFRFLYARAGTSAPPVVGVPFEFTSLEEGAR